MSNFENHTEHITTASRVKVGDYLHGNLDAVIVKAILEGESGLLKFRVDEGHNAHVVTHQPNSLVMISRII